MNRKAIQLAISTIIILTLGILVLISLIIAVTSGFEKYKEVTDLYLDTAEGTALIQTCNLACEGTNPITFCCTEHDLLDITLTCDDSRLGIDCNINCDFQCE